MWEPVDDLGMVCADEINSLITEKFGKCPCIFCQMRRSMLEEDGGEEETEE